ncbi:protein YIPF3 isoform X1 [Hydra vulgaris]|nr:protein YIPF3 [Hydra vulgaris]
MAASPGSLHANTSATHLKRTDYIKRMDSSESSTSSWDLLPNDGTAIIDLGSDTPLSFTSGSLTPTEKNAKNEYDFMQQMRTKIVEEVGGQVWAAGKSQALRFFDLYSNIDTLRPYFDVEPKEVLVRLSQSLVPRKTTKPQTVAGELYGPMMVVFTLVALLLFSMKFSGHTVQEGTLMGTAIGVCFGYWLGGSIFFYFLSYLCNAHITLLQIVSLTGYALFSHCICILLATVTHESTHGVFYIAIFILGGLSSLRMLGVYISRTWSKHQGIIIGSIVATIHLLFLLYLHFAYHSTYEEAANLLNREKRSIFSGILMPSSIAST